MLSPGTKLLTSPLPRAIVQSCNRAYLGNVRRNRTWEIWCDIRWRKWRINNYSIIKFINSDIQFKISDPENSRVPNFTTIQWLIETSATMFHPPFRICIFCTNFYQYQVQKVIWKLSESYFSSFLKASWKLSLINFESFLKAFCKLSIIDFEIFFKGIWKGCIEAIEKVSDRYLKAT